MSRPLPSADLPELLALVRARVRRYQETRDPSVVLDPPAVTEAAALLRAITGPDHPVREIAGSDAGAAACYEVGLLRLYRYEHLPAREAARELRQAAAMLVPLAEFVPGLVPAPLLEGLVRAGATPEEWNEQAADALDHFAEHGTLDVADSAVDLLDDALEATPAGTADHALYLRNRFLVVRARCQATGRRADLDDTIAAGRLAVRANPGEAALAGMLGDELLTWFRSSGEVAALDEAVASLRNAARDVPRGDRNRAAVLVGLCTALRLRSDRSGDPADLRAAIDFAAEAVADLPEDDRNHGAACGELGNAWHSLFTRTGDPGALDTAIVWLRRAAANGSDPAAAAINLGNPLRDRFRHFGELESLHEAVRLYRRAVGASADDTGPGRDHSAAALINLCQVLIDLHDVTHEPDRPAEAVAAARRAIALSSGGTPRHTEAAGACARALGSQFERTGDERHLDEAISLLREVVHAQPENASAHNNLAINLLRRYERTGDTVALDEAGRHSDRAVALTPPDHPDLAYRHSTFGSIMTGRYRRTRQRRVLDRAIDAYDAAVTAIPAGHPDRPSLLRNHANALVERFRASGDPADLDEAIGHLRSAIEKAGSAVDRASYGNDLAIALRARFDHSGEPALLDEAVQLLTQAAEAAPEDDPAHARRLSNLAFALRRQAGFRADPAILTAAADAYRRAASVVASPVQDRIEDAWEWGRVLAAQGEWAAAASACELAVGLLPQAAAPRLVRRDQEHGLRGRAGLPSEAAACALAAGDPERAVRLLEQGRGILIAQQLDPKADLPRLRAEHPALATGFDRLRSRLAGAGGGDEPAGDWLAGAVLAAEQRRTAEQEWRDLVARVRDLPGFTGFLATPPAPSLLEEAVPGPIVLINVSEFRSDALVLTPAGVLPVPLPDATPAAVAGQAARFRAALARTTAAGPEEREAQRTITAVLGWLWDAVTGPVLDRLAPDPVPGPGKPRVWWSPTGLLAFLPLHAAGHHAERAAPRPPTVLDRVVSSYTPTVRALRHARARAAEPEPGGGTLLAVGMPETPGAADLPYAEREVARLAPALTLTGPEATSARLRAELPRHGHVHFACHGVSDEAEPSAGRLLLHDHQANPLTVLEVSRLDLTGARLAYLSACHSSTGAPDLSDEAINLASAFQLAGYPHVVGTLWQVNDRVAATLAAAVHAGLREPGGELSADHTPRSLHEAVLRCRDTYPDTPSLWSAHIHAGA
jgi:tetratricopeptide (TPR) repeat protein